MQEDWIELQTRKYGTVLFNKQTGEVAASPAGTASDQREDVPTSSTTVTAVSRSKKTGKAERDGTVAHRHNQEASGEDGEGADQEVETPQPALRKRKVP